jgi:mannose-6-phosphate isomerase
MKLETHFVEKPWGRIDLPSVFVGAVDRRIGEVWFDQPGSGLPILIKWLFTSDKLSVQVHPGDADAHARGEVSGKEECWVIVAAEPGAKLGIGTREPLDAEALRAASQSGAIEDLIDWKPVRAGDYFYIPAGTVHAIGAGITLVEVQQNIDLTYRLYDYGRPRELHLDDGVAVSHAAPYTDPRSGMIRTDDHQILVDGPLFELAHARGHAIGTVYADAVRRWIIPLDGNMTVGGDTIIVGDCALINKGDAVTVSEDAAALIACE